MDKASADEAEDSGSILGRVKPKIIKIGLHSFHAWHSAIKKDSVKQRWSPREQILKSLASMVKSLALASRPQVLENWPVLGSRTALFFELLKFCGALEKIFGKRFLVGIAWKIFVKTFFFWRALALVPLVLGLEHSCPWHRECLSSERLFFGLGLGFFLCPWPWPRALCPRLHLWCQASAECGNHVEALVVDQKVLFAVSWPTQLGEWNVIAITSKVFWYLCQCKNNGHYC